MGMFDVTAIHESSREQRRHREPVQRSAPSYQNKYGQQDNWQGRQKNEKSKAKASEELAFWRK